MHAQRHRRMHVRTDAHIMIKGGRKLVKSLSREMVMSAALFTRLMPRCTQERVNQACGYTSHPEPRVPRADHSQSPSEPERGYHSQSSSEPERGYHSQSPSEPERGYANGGTHRDEGWLFTRYIGTLFTIRVRMTVV